jgi:hypothetical protein
MGFVISCHAIEPINNSAKDSNLSVEIKNTPADKNKTNGNYIGYISINLNHQNFYTNYADWIDISNKSLIVLDVSTQFRTKSTLYNISYSKNTAQADNNGNRYTDLLLKLTPLDGLEIFGKKLTLGYRQFNFKTTATIKDGNNYSTGYDGVWRKLQPSESMELSTNLRQYSMEIPCSKTDIAQFVYEEDTIPFASSYIDQLNGSGWGGLYTQAKRKRYGIVFGSDKKQEELTDFIGVKSFMVAPYAAQIQATQNYKMEASWRFGGSTDWWPEISYRFEPYMSLASFGKNGKFYLSLPIETFAIPIATKKATLKDIYVNEMLWAIKANFSYKF